MQRLSVYRDNKFYNLDTGIDTPALRKTLFNPDDITKRGSGYTYSFTLPATAINEEFFQYYSQPQTYNPNNSNLGIATYYWNEAPLFTGVLTLRGYSKDGYDVGIRQLDQGWVDLAQVNCRDVEIGNELVCLNNSGGAFDVTDGVFAFPLADFGRLQENPLVIEAGYLRQWSSFNAILRSALSGFNVISPVLDEYNPHIYTGEGMILRSNNLAVKWNTDNFTKIFNSNPTGQPSDVATIFNFGLARWYLLQNPNENKAELSQKLDPIFNKVVGWNLSPFITCLDTDWVELEVSWDIELIADNPNPYPLGLYIYWGTDPSQVELLLINGIPAGATGYSLINSSSKVIRGISQDMFFGMFFQAILTLPLPTDPTISGNIGINIKATENIYNLNFVPADNFPNETVSEVLGKITSVLNMNVTTDSANNVYIEPIVDQARNDSFIIDWTLKVDTEDYDIETDESFSANKVKFTWLESDGYLNKRWKTGTSLPNQPNLVPPANPFIGNFGDFTATTNSYVQEEQEVEGDYASFIQVNYPLNSTSPYFGENIWRSAPFENNYGETYIGTYYEAVEDQNNTLVGATYGTPVPNAGMGSRTTWFQRPIPSIMFSVDGYSFNSNVAIPTTRNISWRFDDPTNTVNVQATGIYNRFWKDFFDETINQRVFVFKVYLEPEDIVNIDLRNRIRIENRYYRLIELDSWTPDIGIATCRMIQLQ